MKKLVILTIVFLNSAYASFSQQTNLDSLWNVWQDKTEIDSVRASAFNNYIKTEFLFSQPDSAYALAELLAEFGRLKNYPKAVANAYNFQGISFYLKGDYKTALNFYKQALEIRREIKDLKGIASSLNNVGTVYNILGDFNEALLYYEESLTIQEELNDSETAATILGNIGENYRRLGEFNKALDYHQKSLLLFKELKDKKGIANAYNKIGLTHHSQGSYGKALDAYEESLLLKKQLDDNAGMALTLNNIGLIYKNQGIYNRALDYYNKSLAIREKLGKKNGIASSLNNIGIIYERQGDLVNALKYYEQSLKLKEEIGDKNGIAISLNNIGSFYHSQNNDEQALNSFNKSLKLKKEIGQKRGVASTLGNIGVVYEANGDLAAALKYYEESLAIIREVGADGRKPGALLKIGGIYRKRGDYNKAIEYCTEGYNLAQEMGLLVQEKLGCECLYNSFKELGQGDRALLYHEKLNLVEDSLRKGEAHKKLQQMEFKRIIINDSIHKAEEVRLLQQRHQDELTKEENQRNIAISIGGFFVILALSFYSRWRYVRKSKAVLQTEKDRSENLLLNILPEEIAQELKEKGRADARNFEQVSILFTDFKGFTEQSEKLSAAALVQEINSCFEAFDGIMEKYGIEKIKTIGDAYMAAGGLPVPTDESVKNTVLAALEMKEFIIKRKASKEAQNLSPSGGGMGEDNHAAFEMRVGIHTGPVVAGIVGVKKFQYDIWGDTVNTASRMESSGEVGKVNISQATYELLKDDEQFTFE
ncbi:MAG: tetratricopeptide repeat protein, partial [Schleiferiaceae bacterium]|nr:tetratricopeptide repeat protein [Schleiferiaceae bacterium]